MKSWSVIGRFRLFGEDSFKGNLDSWSSWLHCFPKASSWKCFPSTLKRKTGVLFKIIPIWKALLKKRHFRDGWVWTIKPVNLTVKIEQLGFQISPAWCERRLKFCFPDLSTSRFLSRTTWWPCEGRILTVSTTCYSLRKIIAIMKQQNYSFYRK